MLSPPVVQIEQPVETVDKEPHPRATFAERLKKRLKRQKGDKLDAVNVGNMQPDGDGKQAGATHDDDESYSISSAAESPTSPRKSIGRDIDSSPPTPSIQPEPYHEQDANSIETTSSVRGSISITSDQSGDEGVMRDLAELASLSRKTLAVYRRLLDNPSSTSSDLANQIEETMHSISDDVEQALGTKFIKSHASPPTVADEQALILEKYSEMLARMVQEKIK